MSREHVELEYNNTKGIVYIKDLKSKYGTLIKLNEQKIDLKRFS